MTMREVAILLANMGNEVKYTIRNDGGIRITYINGQRFTGSTGNTIARNMVGATISETRVKQLGKIRTPKGKWGHKKLDDVGEEIKKEIRRLQRLYRKRGNKAGIPTLRKYRANIKLYGKEEAERLLRQASRYGLGLAYESNVYSLASRVEMDGRQLNSQSLIDVAKEIRQATPYFKEDWIKTIYEILYDFEAYRHITADEVANMIRNILRR